MPTNASKFNSETLSTKSGYRVPLQSQKRKKASIRYSTQIKDFWEESKANNTDFCFFCGTHMKKRDNIHHLKGRTNDYLLDKEWWVNAHNSCHLDFHFLSIENLMKKPWYDEFLERLRLKDTQLYYKMRVKEEKAQFNLDIN